MAALTTALLGTMAAMTMVKGIADSQNAMGQAEAAQKEAKQKADADAAAMKKQMEEEEKRRADMEKSAANAAAQEDAEEDKNSMRARQKAAAKGAYGRSDTILTGPLGLVNPAQTAKKTLLGA